MKENSPNNPHPEVEGKVDSHFTDFCQLGSNEFNQMIDDDPMEDWRSVRGRHAIQTGRDPDSRSPVYMGGKIK